MEIPRVTRKEGERERESGSNRLPLCGMSELYHGGLIDLGLILFKRQLNVKGLSFA